jgi:hypothetical protein
MPSEIPLIPSLYHEITNGVKRLRIIFREEVRFLEHFDLKITVRFEFPKHANAQEYCSIMASISK